MRPITSVLLLWYCLTTGTEAIWRFNLNAQLPAPTVEGDFEGTYLSLPSYDPWYKAPEGWEKTKPGTVLRIRQHAYNFTPIPIANVKDTFQVLFRSTNSLENATWGVTTVFIPNKSHCEGLANCSQGLVNYQLPYDTSCLDASPSFGLQWGEPYGEIGQSLGRGWWVSVPDFGRIILGCKLIHSQLM